MRIANYLKIDFGTIFDIGIDIKLVEICLKLFLFARHKQKEKEYTLKMSQAIWAKGVDIEKEENQRLILKECGLSFDEYVNEFEPNYLKKDEHIKMTEDNLKKLYDAKNWGVPSIQFRNRCVWGQDRMWALSQEYASVFDEETKAAKL